MKGKEEPLTGGDPLEGGEAPEMADAQLGSAAYLLEGKPYWMKRRERSEQI